jgi:hypothetical protein
LYTFLSPKGPPLTSLRQKKKVNAGRPITTYFDRPVLAIESDVAAFHLSPLSMWLVGDEKFGISAAH